jgi:hypothetical protein
MHGQPWKLRYAKTQKGKKEQKEKKTPKRNRTTQTFSVLQSGELIDSSERFMARRSHGDAAHVSSYVRSAVLLPPRHLSDRMTKHQPCPRDAAY